MKLAEKRAALAEEGKHQKAKRRGKKVKIPSTRDIAALAERHGIAPGLETSELPRLETIIHASVASYHNPGRGVDYYSEFSEPDTLDQVEKAAGELSALLHNERNSRRLIRGQSDDFIAKFHELAAILDAVRLAASRNHRSHRPGKRGHPVVKGDLAVAYQGLVWFWRETFGDDAFKNNWHRDPKTGLTPITDAARFLYDAMKLIDPTRPRLAAELRRLMNETVADIPGPRKGRRTLR
jgi:hypothetical protein